MAGGEVVGLLHPGGDEALVVPKVEVGFSAVFGHKHFAVLERRHRAGVDVDVGVEFDEGDFEAARFKQGGEGGGCNSLAQGRHYTAGDEYKLGHARAGAQVSR